MTTSRTFSHRCRAWSALADLAGLFRTLAGALGDHYRPELHYMRGPGPKWRAKHRPPLCFRAAPRVAVFGSEPGRRGHDRRLRRTIFAPL